MYHRYHTMTTAMAETRTGRERWGMRMTKRYDFIFVFIIILLLFLFFPFYIIINICILGINNTQAVTLLPPQWRQGRDRQKKGRNEDDKEVSFFYSFLLFFQLFTTTNVNHSCNPHERSPNDETIFHHLGSRLKMCQMRLEYWVFFPNFYIFIFMFWSASYVPSHLIIRFSCKLRLCRDTRILYICVWLWVNCTICISIPFQVSVMPKVVCQAGR